MACQRNHRYDVTFENLPHDQGGDGRHKCAACAYEKGFEAGESLNETISLNLDELDDSQAGTIRHKSPHAAFAQGYLDGVNSRYGI